MSADAKSSLILAAVILLTCLPFFAGYFFLTGDMRDVTVPLETFFHQQTLVGHLPSWDPDAAWGFPVIAAAQIGYFYPPLLVLRFLPVYIYLPLVLIIHLLAAALGMYLFLRRQQLSAEASFLGAAAFSLSAFLWQHITHLNLALAIAWVPWTLLAADSLSRDVRDWKRRALFALSLALPMLIGQLQVPLFVDVLAVAYFLSHTWKKPKAPLISLAVVGVLAVALCAVQWLPTLELVHYSSRGPDGDFDVVRANQHSYPLYHLPTLLFPRFYGNDASYWGKRLEIEYGLFIGTLPLLLALWAAVKNYRQQKFWVWVAGISFLLALGGASPFRLIGLEPSLWVFSAPARWLLLTTVALCVLAAVGYNRLKEAADRASFLRWLKVVTIAVTACVLLANSALVVLNSYSDTLGAVVLSAIHSYIPQIPLTKEPAYYQEKIQQMIAQASQSSISLLSPFAYLPIISLLAGWFVLARKKSLHVILVISVLELLVIASTTSPLATWKNLLSVPATVAQLPESVRDKQARIFSIRDGGDNGAFFTDPASRANSAIREDQRKLLVPLLHTLYGVAGVEWPASIDMAGATKALASIRGNEGYEVTDVQAARDLNIGAILEKKHTDAAISITDLGATSRAELHYADGSKAAVKYVSISASQIRVEANATAPAQLVIKDSWFPGWEATLDGRPVAVQVYNGIFRQVAFPAGQHSVEMKYVPTQLYRGLEISVFALAITLIFLLFPLSRILHI
jgi:hypothetical protein